MTTQFSQLVSYTFLLRMSPDNSYFILCPRTVSVQSNKSLTFGGYGSFSGFDSIVPHYSPSYPVDFQQFGASWCEESLIAYFNSLGIGSYINSIQYEGIRFVENGNRLSASGINSSILLCNLFLNNQIDTDFDNLFANLISSLNTLLTPISQISLSLLGINNIFPILVHNLEAINENNVPVSIAQILKDKQINVDMSDTQVSLDDTNLVTQLQNIYTILSSQNANQSAISSAISNKDNQSDIVSILNDIFISKNNSGSIKKSVFKSYNNLSSYNDDVINFGTFYNEVHRILSCLTNLTSVSSNINEISVANRPLVGLMALSSNFSTPSNVLNNSHLKAISTTLNNIESKLEQNLPFTTNVDNVLVIDGQQEFKIRNKDDSEDFV